MSPFIDASAFATMFRPLSAAETAVAAPLLEVVSNWIREQKPDIADEDPAAKLVCFEVTRDALVYGKYAGLTDFSETTGRRTKSGTINTAEIERFVTDRHRRMLGVEILAGPAYSFKPCDY